jgi:hypothetical protein
VRSKEERSGKKEAERNYSLSLKKGKAFKTTTSLKRYS